MSAVMKIRDEMATNPSNSYIQVVGNYLLSLLHENPHSAGAIMTCDKTIKGSLAAMQAEARKNQVNGCGVLTDDEGFAVVRAYFGIDGALRPDKAGAAPTGKPLPAGPARRGIDFDVTLDDLLGPRG